MNSTANPLDSLIAAKRAEVVDAERKLERLRIELATLEQAHAAVGPMNNGRRRSKGRTQKRSRSLSEGWKKILTAIGAHGRVGAPADAILKHAAEAGVTIQRHTLRSQMSNYAKRGLIDRPRDGFYRLTIEGQKAAGILPLNWESARHSGEHGAS